MIEQILNGSPTFAPLFRLYDKGGDQASGWLWVGAVMQDGTRIDLYRNQRTRQRIAIDDSGRRYRYIVEGGERYEPIEAQAKPAQEEAPEEAPRHRSRRK